MNVPEISIVMPTYNSEKYVSASIDSILMQSFTNFELIIVDDGSTDNTTNIVRSYKDKRIKLHQNFHSFIQTLNLGIKLSKGKYIARMDADDIMKFHRLEVQFEYMESNSEVDICGSWMETFGEEFQCIKTPVKHNDIVVTLIKNNALCHPTIIMRRESLQRFEHFPYIYNEQFIYAEDYKLWTDLIIAGFKFSNISKVLLKYRISNSQNTVRFASRMKENSVNIQKNYLNFISEKIVEFDSTLFDFLNRAINLHNSNYLTFNALQQISLDIIKRQLTESNAKYKI